jgi:hypothetical protein
MIGWRSLRSNEEVIPLPPRTFIQKSDELWLARVHVKALDRDEP